MRTIMAAVLLLFQTTAAFEVASVKPSQPGFRSGASLDAAHFTGTGLTLRSLIFSAYRIPPWRLTGGPGWLDTEQWDVAATMPPGMPTKREELTPIADRMLQALLADRFKLTVHREMRDQQTYELVVAKSGLKFKQASTEKFSGKPGRGHLELHKVSMAALVSNLYFPPPYDPQSRVDRPVIDKTELKGLYDVTLDWDPEAGPSIFTALEEQVGLKLEPHKSPIEFLVIDHVEKPAEN